MAGKAKDSTRKRSGPKRRSLAERFEEKVDRSGGRDACHLWTASTNNKGYGKICGGGRYGRKLLAHRLSWELANGPITDGLCCLHRCDVRACCNPTHLFLGTYGDNTADMFAKGRGVTPLRRGEANGRARVSAADAIAIRADPRSQRVIAAEYGVNQRTVGRIKHGKSWGWLFQDTSAATDLPAGINQGDRHEIRRHP